MNGINEKLIFEHKKEYWTFNNFLKNIEGFNSIKQYDLWLGQMGEEERNNTRWYYVQKFLQVLKIADNN